MSISGERSTLSKLTYVPGLVVATVLSSILVYLNVTGTASHGRFFDLVNEHRASVQIIVQVICITPSWTCLYSRPDNLSQLCDQATIRKEFSLSRSPTMVELNV